MKHATSTDISIAFLGTGLMGQPMAERLLAAGYPVTVYNRTLKKTETLQKAGAHVAHHPAEAVRHAACIILMLADEPAIQAVLLDAQTQAEIAGRTVIQMGTIGSSESRLLSRRVEALGGEYLEAPVLGSIPQVRSDSLIIMVGSTPGQFATWSKVLKSIASNTRWVGEVGQAAALKLALNQLIAALTAGFSLSLGIVKKSSLPLERFLEILRDSALYAPTFEKKFPRVSTGNYENPNFPLHLFLKDLDLILNEAAGFDTAWLRSLRDLVARKMTEETREADYSVLYEMIVAGRNE